MDIKCSTLQKFYVRSDCPEVKQTLEHLFPFLTQKINVDPISNICVTDTNLHKAFNEGSSLVRKILTRAFPSFKPFTYPRDYEQNAVFIIRGVHGLFVAKAIKSIADSIIKYKYDEEEHQFPGYIFAPFEIGNPETISLLWLDLPPYLKKTVYDQLPNPGNSTMTYDVVKESLWTIRDEFGGATKDLVNHVLDTQFVFPADCTKYRAFIIPKFKFQGGTGIFMEKQLVRAMEIITGSKWYWLHDKETTCPAPEGYMFALASTLANHSIWKDLPVKVKKHIYE